MIRSLSLAAAGVFFALSAQASDTAAIEQVMAGFHQAVVSHDGDRLKGFFLPQGTAWFTVLTDEALAKRPGAPKVRPGSYQDFAAFVSTGKADLDPRHTEVEIRSDGTVAMAWFHFSFLIGGQEKNRGYETWQLLKSEEGWKIAAISYSSDPAP
jgi:ketosteroid isomerase-like protein